MAKLETIYKFGDVLASYYMDDDGRLMYICPRAHAGAFWAIVLQRGAHMGVAASNGLYEAQEMFWIKDESWPS